MTPAVIQLDDADSQRLKELAEQSGRPLSELAREAIREYLARHTPGGSLFAIPPHPSGPLLRPWTTREELLDEMLDL